MPRLNIYLPDAVYELASKWRDSANLSEICARAINDELGAAEKDRSYSRVLAKIRPPTDLEAALIKQFNLTDVLVAETPPDSKELRNAIGRGAAAYLDRNLSDGAFIAVAGGRQIWCTVQHLSARRLRTTITALGMHRADPRLLHVHPNTIVTLMWLLYSPRSLAHIVGAMPVDNEWLQELPTKSNPSYFVVASCSSFQSDSPFAHLLGSDVTRSLLGRDVLGDYAYVFFDRSGRELEITETTDQFRLPATTLRDLTNRSDGRTILVAGGEDKVEIMTTTLRQKLCNTLITDDETARRLLR